jgi:hypothetical protein
LQTADNELQNLHAVCTQAETADTSTKLVTVSLEFTAKVRGIMLTLPEMQRVLGHCSSLANLPSDESPFSTLGSAFAVMSCVGTASINPRPIYPVGYPNL